MKKTIYAKLIDGEFYFPESRLYQAQAEVRVSRAGTEQKSAHEISMYRHRVALAVAEKLIEEKIIVVEVRPDPESLDTFVSASVTAMIPDNHKGQ